ncbi:MAG: hypothetical protein DWB56_07300 [Candidatus Jettenia sp.]|uniref:Uncharacterized protein n=1 Tax=Candidatus Jettenia caeni TaxID=247490 RepID=I3IMP1_9BACT|nr:hypothetical protein [Candidatus Jettenia sp. AMX1]MBC6928754.1 hypothetical protein [Candidatus Jettenia sp.]WKZ14741.1 MAG: hypothetical protein QY317_12630 [Candidatus Jettenia caeni]KAA0250726.1 MAG: hypothetical protein EDM77_04235 [Candidatus Jettenia sp. AMX1]MCE7880066.1 hypothetical protein [Candidatus Jettenia sp. AMX1]MCQ3926847.1 hypothetical protein [Candidatus Jettenia sp.]
MKSLKVMVLLVSVFLALTLTLIADEIITNDTILTMVKAGLGDELVITKIKTSQNQFDVSTKNILKLKNEGVGDNIIKAMLEASAKQKAVQKVSPAESSRSEQGTVPREKEQKKSGNVDYDEKDIYYARCNLKVIKGNRITWVNWQSTPVFIPVGTKLKVVKSGDTASVINVETGSSYTLDIGGDGDALLEKFVTKKPIDIDQFPADVQSNIRNTVARIGMTKEEVYIAMGPPTNISSARTKTMTYEDIMGADLWVYARRRAGKSIGVAFDPGTGRVNRTEGIWK